MIYSIVFSIIFPVLAVVLFKSPVLYIVLMSIFALTTAFFSFLSKKYDKLTIVFLFIGLLLAGFGYIRGYAIDLFMVITLISTTFSSLFSFKNKKLYIVLAWLFNAMAIGTYVYLNVSLSRAILIAVLVFLAGYRDIMPQKSTEEEENS
ncbi:hypothetical protein XO10_02380 [Marinitoga sp. 1135]|uniref:Uncharacterized protein n=1 Tax=Marinitoga piezophila (strain DSM 14283 / JCM 11233 / KA3) TaxID=443254 RepID=H2J4X0_MARPK|nr:MULTISPECIES: hypothetical protein [Marinitoga]AEX84905.1 hypothetical protein Marpi_0462 [Marinitoga piezophila KA3]NUU95139.1 hypothetical protein [Marinitoga sp. 1135]NUU97071.1 hypothetical protein [Marinitoga sp. 1138]